MSDSWGEGVLMHCRFVSLSSTHSWRTSRPNSWLPWWGVICPATAAIPGSCGSCCWRNSPAFWTQRWTCWPTRSAAFGSMVSFSSVFILALRETGLLFLQSVGMIPLAEEILDVIEEIRLSALTDGELADSGVIHLWFTERLSVFLPFASGRFLLCLTSRNLSCPSYQQMWVRTL